MTAEELVIGHYERTLTEGEEAELAQLVESEPDVRVLFEQHGRIDTMLVAEAGAIDTTSKLDKVVIGAALGTLVEIAGKGIGISLLGKIAAVVATVAVGTVGFVLIDPFGGEEPAPSAPASRRAAPPAAAAPAPVAPDSLETASTDAGDVTVARADSSTARMASPTRTRAAAQTRPSGSDRPGLVVDPNKADATVENPPRVNSGDGR